MATAVTTTVLLLITFFTATNSAVISTGSVSPNFTASHFTFIDQTGNFLRSINGTYTAAILSEEPTSSSFYVVVYHTDSRAVVWTANRNKPISDSGQFRLTDAGISIYDDSGSPGALVWATPPVESKVGSLHLFDSGNLVMLDSFNKTVWQSFDYPTDTVVSGQKFLLGKTLVSLKSPADYSAGDYKFTLTSYDGMFQWRNSTYYRLLMDPKFIKNSNQPISYLMVNGSGFYLFGDSGVVVQILLTTSDQDVGYRMLKLTDDGYLTVRRFTDKNWVTDFTTPADTCRTPNKCGRLGLCSAGECSCPPGFHNDPKRNTGGCSFLDSSLSFPSSSCDGNESLRRGNSSDTYSYVNLGKGMKYFDIDFMNPFTSGVSLPSCEDLCSAKCSCLGLFHESSSGSCYLIFNYLGSITSSSSNESNDKLGFIKAISSTSPSRFQDGNSSSDFPVIGLVLVPVSGVLLITIFAIWISRRRSNKKMRSNSKKLVDNSYLDDLEMFSIAGLPVRFDHEDLVQATANFSTQIGSGGFGTVYKGVLRDKTVVAVKKITALGAAGKKEFGTEITIIGNIHHVNLVKLKGFCAHGRDRFLVYEYMSRGSLDRTIFGNGPPLEWQERYEIAVGTARGLAYLHNGCEHKIIHCDVKPENILLSDTMQVKISDFGLSKLLSPEQSGLFTTMRGTRGYLAPEWLTNAAISDKTDVYSYGMVLLELIQGRKNCVQAQTHSSGNPATSTDGGSSKSSGSRTHHRARAFYFPLHALEMHEEGNYLDLVDPRLANRVSTHEAEKLVKIALCCLHEDPSLRPTMANVVAMLEQTLPVSEPRLELLNFLRFYGRRLTEPSMAETGVDVEVPSGFMLQTIDSSCPSVSPSSCSYVSTQQVSGPR